MSVCLIFSFLHFFIISLIACFNHVRREDHLAFDTTKWWKLHG